MQSGKILSECKDRNHYPSYSLWKDNKGKRIKTHRLVAEAFLGGCPAGMEVNHIDGDKNNNHVANLEYVTHRDNVIHAFNLGLAALPPINRGSDDGMSKLIEIEVHQIRKMIHDGRSQRKIAVLFGVSQHTISDINTGKTWVWLSENEEIVTI